MTNNQILFVEKLSEFKILLVLTISDASFGFFIS